MPRYALLTRESSNRVFGKSAPGLLAAEIEAVGVHLSGGVTDVSTVEYGGLAYVAFESGTLTDIDSFILSNLALGRGLFEWLDAGLLSGTGIALAPVDRSPLRFFDSDLISIQRYIGKTNEQFTHLLVNLALAESQSAHTRAASGERVRLFDPVAGRGSTLNRGLMYGFDVAGVELDETHFDQYRVFLSTYLKDHRFKHKVTTERIRKGEFAGTAGFDVNIGARHGESQRVRMVRGSTDVSSGLLQGVRFDVVAGDLPYGLVHSAKSASSKAQSSTVPSPKGRASSERSPERLVADSLRSWRKLMYPGAALGLSWNTKTLTRETLGNVLDTGGLEVVTFPRSFEHEVDRQITRDVIVARR